MYRSVTSSLQYALIIFHKSFSFSCILTNYIYIYGLQSDVIMCENNVEQLNQTNQYTFDFKYLFLMVRTHKFFQ